VVGNGRLPPPPPLRAEASAALRERLSGEITTFQSEEA